MVCVCVKEYNVVVVVVCLHDKVVSGGCGV